ncbi:unnamed protein product, partial [Ilex paraguariensis]
NSLSGSIPRCLTNLTFESNYAKSVTGSKYDLFPPGISQFSLYSSYFESIRLPNVKEKVEFPTKGWSYSYDGNILIFMSGIDFSCNQLTGKIPSKMGNLSELHSLNVSHNNLTGSIPTTFSNLRHIGSLDLSYTNLNGSIPSELTELNTLVVCSVAHNNLTGKTPDFKAQFATFNEISYEGNPHLWTSIT